MTRRTSIAESGKFYYFKINFFKINILEAKSFNSRASELSVLNDDECKRILSVVERDFKLRQKEFQRLE
jgi:hypothetical protein